MCTLGQTLHCHTFKPSYYSFVYFHVQQITTHGNLLSNDELQQLALSIGMSEETVSWFLLQEFGTELDFSNKVRWVVLLFGISSSFHFAFIYLSTVPCVVF